MSENTQAQQPKKMLLSALLPKVERIAFGADAGDRLPDEEGHDPATAPDKWTLWIAGVLRIHLRRSIEHVVEFRKAIAEIREITKDLPALRERVREMTGLLQEIVRQIEIARGQAAPDAAPDAPPPASAGPEAQVAPATAPTDEALDDKPLSPEEMLRRAEQAQIRDLAKAAAAKAAADTAPNVTPIQAPAKARAPKPANSGKTEPPAA